MRKRNVPPVARPTGARLLVELGKDLLIVALTCSALFLAAQTPMASHLRGWVAPPEPTAVPVLQSSQLVYPYAMSIRNDKGLYGVSYDEAAVNRAFDRFASFLGEAISAHGAPETIPPARWRALLDSPGVCWIFQGQPPLSTLAARLGVTGELSGFAQSLLLAWDGQEMWLAWREGEEFYRAATTVSYEGHLSAALDDFSPNGAAFAYTLSDDEVYDALDPYVLVTMAAPQPKVYTALSPDLTVGGEDQNRLLTALGFLPSPETSYVTADGLAVTESGDRLLLTSAGEVSFRAGEETRYPVREGGAITPLEAARAAGELLSRATAAWAGEGDYVLTGVHETDAGWEVTFHTRLGGVPLLTARDGWSARFLLEKGRISEFFFTLRAYTPTEETTVLPHQRLAAAAMRSLPKGSGQLMLCYSDNRNQTLTAGWVTGE